MAKRKWTEEERKAQSARLKRYWSSQSNKSTHSLAMKEHWEERKKKLTPTQGATKAERLERAGAIATIASIKEFVEKKVGTSLNLTQVADIVCSYYARKENV